MIKVDANLLTTGIERVMQLINERKLVASVLYRSVLDLGTPQNKLAHNGATAFFTSEDEPLPFNLSFCCEYLEIDRGRLLKHLINRRLL